MRASSAWLWPVTLALLATGAAVGAWGSWAGWNPDVTDTFLFVAWIAALFLLFLLGLRLPLQARLGRFTGLAYTWSLVLGAFAVALLANIALFRHDVHFDLTRERAFTPSPQAQAIIRALTRDVRLTYFYQSQDHNGRRAKDLLEILGRRSPYLHVRAVDPDKQPLLAEAYGVRLYNAAVLEADGRRIQVLGTDETEIVLGILRVLRQQVKAICFIEGHGEFSIDNFELHTHFEVLQGHTHGGEGSSVVLTERHGVGRMRRALESLGFEVRKIVPATLRAVPDDCAAVVDVNPRATYLPAESDLLAAYLARGGAAVLMYDLGFVLEPRLAGLLARLGVAFEQEVVVDPLDHYSTDPEIVAVPVYESHPITERIALTFYPGVRPIALLQAPPGVNATPLFLSSKKSYTRRVKPVEERLPTTPQLPGAGGPRPTRSPPTAEPAGAAGPRVLAVAVEGTWSEFASGGKPFRVVMVGDGDFASNSFFPYMSNSDMALSMVRWAVGEDRQPAIRPPIPVLPIVLLTKRQMQQIFVAVEIILPLSVMVCGAVVWWRRR